MLCPKKQASFPFIARFNSQDSSSLECFQPITMLDSLFQPITMLTTVYFNQSQCSTVYFNQSQCSTVYFNQSQCSTVYLIQPITMLDSLFQLDASTRSWLEACRRSYEFISEKNAQDHCSISGCFSEDCGAADGGRYIMSI